MEVEVEVEAKTKEETEFAGDNTKREWLTTTMLSNKRRCLNTVLAMSLKSPNSRILEVGFNSGHSSAMFLTLFKKARIQSFDLCLHVYTEPTYEWLKEVYGSQRLSLICGNSHLTIPAYEKVWREEEGEERFDISFIDAGHYYEVGESVMNVVQPCLFPRN